MFKPQKLFAVLLFVSVAAYGSGFNLTHKYDVDKIQTVISEAVLLNQIPQFEGIELSRDFQVVPGELDPELKSLFDEIQRSVFNKTLISLRLCSDCLFYADYPHSSVLIQASEVEVIRAQYANSENILKYILAHELSHFLHEISSHSPYSSVDFVTINGLPSAYKALFTMEDFDLEKMFKSHAEVDVYVVQIMKKMNFDGWDDVFKYFESEIAKADPTDEDSGKWVHLDFSNRLRVVKEALGKK